MYKISFVLYVFGVNDKLANDNMVTDMLYGLCNYLYNANAMGSIKELLNSFLLRIIYFFWFHEEDG